MSVPAKPQPSSLLLSCAEAACCTRSEPKEKVPQLMLLEPSVNPPSLAQMCCLCSFDERRENSGIEDVPELRGLAGVTMQTDGGAENNVQTLKWASFDARTRTAKTRNIRGAVCCGHVASSQLATWLIATPEGCPALCLCSCGMTALHRPCDFTYKFVFDESWSRADIKCMLNCCPCVPCVPAWCQVPDALVRFEMVQADGSRDGTHWLRNSALFGGPMKKSYELKEVYRPDGTPGRFHDLFVERAPKSYYMTR